MKHAKTLILLVAVALFAGCAGTVTPERVAPAEVASFDPQDSATPTSGIISVDNDGATITPGARNRYNALVDDYGDEFVPEIRKDYGITELETGMFRINNAALEKWLIMSDWKRMGR